MSNLDTRAEAFKEILKELTSRQEDVVNALFFRTEATLFDLADDLDLPAHSISGRLTELRKKGIIEDTGKRAVNQASNRKAVVWRLK